MLFFLTDYLCFMEFTDQLGRTINLSKLPERIVSLVPSQTELVFDLGLEQELVGITKFCIHPSHLLRDKKIVGGTKQLKPDEIARLKPDLILANKEENREEDILELSKSFPVWVSDVDSVKSGLAMIRQVGQLTGKKLEAGNLAEAIEQAFNQLPFSPDYSAIYLIWDRPMMGVGGDTYISDCMEKAGFSNSLGQMKRYPEIQLETLQELKPDFVFLSSEPYPFGLTHLVRLQEKLQHSKVVLVDGEMFSWYGSRMLDAAKYFRKLRTEIV